MSEFAPNSLVMIRKMPIYADDLNGQIGMLSFLEHGTQNCWRLKWPLEFTLKESTMLDGKFYGGGYILKVNTIREDHFILIEPWTFAFDEQLRRNGENQ